MYHIAPWRFSSGWLGVDAFFVISGFVLSRSILSSARSPNHSLYRLLWKRFLRIYPTLLVSLWVTLPIIFLVIQSPKVRQYGYLQALASICFSANITASALSPAYFEANLNPYLHLWSISIEIQIYLMCLLAITLTRIVVGFINQYYVIKFKTLGLPIALFYGFLLLLVFCLSYFLTFFGISPYYNPGYRTLEFMVGMISFQAGLRLSKRPCLLHSHFFRRICIGTLIGLIFFSSSRINPIFLILFTQLCVLLLLVIVPSLKHSNTSFLVSYLNKLIWQIGEISYSWYLLHQPLWYVVQESKLEFRYEVLLFLSLLYVLSFTMYQFVERRFLSIKIAS